MFVLSKDYIKEADRQLKNNAYCQQLIVDPTPQHIPEVKRLVHSMCERGLNDKRSGNFLVPCQPLAARLYLLPKLHKPRNLGWPIVSSNGTPMENVT